MERPLTPLELSQVSFGCNFSTLAVCETPRLADRRIAEEICRQAVRCATRRHAAATVTVDWAAKALKPADPRVVFTTPEDGENLEEFADREESKTLVFGEYSSGWHFGFRSDTEMFVSLRITHATSDGLGSIYLMTSFLQYLNEGTSPTDVEPLPLRNPHSKIRRVTAAPVEDFPEPTPRKLPGKGVTHRTLRYRFDEGISNALVQAARRHGLTVQGCFTSLVSFALTPLFPKEEARPLVLVNPKQLRDLVEDHPPVLKNEVIMGPTNLLLPTPLVPILQDLWPTAKVAYEELQRQLRCDVPRWNISRLDNGWDFVPRFSSVATSFGKFFSPGPEGPSSFHVADCCFSLSFVEESTPPDLDLSIPEFQTYSFDDRLYVIMFYSPQVLRDIEAKNCLQRIAEGVAFMSQTETEA